jgi:hypothetical protein
VTVGDVGLAGGGHFGGSPRKAEKLEREGHLGIEDQAGYRRDAEDRSPGSHAEFGDRIESGEAAKVASRCPEENPREQES